MRWFGLAAGLAVVMLAVWATPVSAHEGAAPSTPASDERREARDLTDEIRQLAGSAGNPALRAQLVAKAERRRDLLQRLAKTNPRAVLEAATRPGERDTLPASIRQLIEEWVSRRGVLLVDHIDYEDGHGEYDARLESAGQETTLRIARGLGRAQPGDTVQVTGVDVAGDGGVVTDQVQLLAQASSLPGPTGSQRTALILVNQPGGAATHPYANTTNTASVFFSSTNTLSAELLPRAELRSDDHRRGLRRGGDQRRRLRSLQRGKRHV